MIIRLDSGINNIDLSFFSHYIPWSEQQRFFLQEVGENHCKLLAYISYQLPARTKVADLGTSYGASAIALSYNPDIQVTTYDPADHVSNYPLQKSYKDLLNVQYYPIDCSAVVDRYVDSKVIFMDIGLHEGVYEKRIFDELVRLEFKGLLVCDDIHWNDPMRQFWSSIELKKHDITNWGHWSGTGIVVFDPNTIDIEIG